MKLRLSIFCLVITQCIFAQITFVIEELPENHDYSKSIYISGDFEGWSGGQESYKLEHIDEQYSITLPLDQSTIQFKFTMGSWDSVERDVEGNQTDNRIHKLTEEKGVIKVKIASWDERLGDAVAKSTAANNVTILAEDFEIPELDRKRRIWMYLPPDYHSSDEKYPVLYMHDGQNVFDALTSYAGEWSVDESLNRLFRLHNFRLIVVAIDNGGDKRMNEYSPWDDQHFGKAEGDAYVNFIANSLKPYIDGKFRTLSDRNDTGIMGSSMGGLISHYAALKYPNIFGKSGVFSPSFGYAKESYNFASNHSNVSDLQMYFLVGGNESDTMVPNMVKMVDLMKSEGFNSENVKHKIVEEGIHNERFWKEEFEEAILWLFPNALKNREFINAKMNDSRQLEVQVSDGKYVIQFYSPEIVETTFIPTDQKFIEGSHAVSLKPTNLISSIQDEEDSVLFGLESLKVHIQKSPFNISYKYNGKEIISERNGYRKVEDHETLQFNLTKDEILYGGGARALGMNRRGHRLKLYNRAHYGYETESELMNYTMPLMLSSKQYAIHFDNAPIGYLDLDSKNENILTYETISGRKTYQLIVGDSWIDLIDNYTDLTGKQPLPPRWALGNFSSRFGYHSEKETRETVQKFKEERIPLDAVIIDIYWFGKDIQGHMGNFEWQRDSFPTPTQMIKDFKQMGVKTVLVSEPFILTTSKRWDEAVNENILAKDSIGEPFKFDFYFGNTGLIDIYNPNGKQWFWNIYKSLAEQGVQGIWGDLGEPEVHPSNLIHASGTADEVHNIYGHDWARLVYEGYKTDFPDQRPFILMRSGFSGSQRFGLIPWSGDVNRTWGGLQSQTEIALQMGMQGLGYMHSDLGGFAGANLDDELYTRWLQYGVFQPIYRPHAQEQVPSEPVYREQNTKSLAKESIELRYQLLPYNYTLAFQNNQHGTPLMRPVFFEDHNLDETLTIASTYLWGSDFLITPVVHPGEKEVAVYFPKNDVWFDFYSNKRIFGGQTKMINTKVNSIPTFVRAGAFIPMAKLVQSTEEYSTAEFDLHYYHDATVFKSSRMLYDDDGNTAYAFEKEQYEILHFESEMTKKQLNIEMESTIGKNYSTKNRKINLVVHNIDNRPRNVKVNGKKVKMNWDSDRNLLTFPIVWLENKEVKVKIKL